MQQNKHYSWIREGFEPAPLEWYSVEDCLPKILEDDYGDNRSKPVLAYLRNGFQFTAYLRQYEDYNPEWILCGRDGYIAEEVTHWRWLPLRPTQN